MKKKFSLWFNIVTIYLCMCAIVIGVYAVSTATLTLSGQIGFTAHGCKVNVTGYIYGHGMKNGLDSGSLANITAAFIGVSKKSEKEKNTEVIAKLEEIIEKLRMEGQE